MRALDLAELAAVTGGGTSTTEVDVAGARVRSSQTDYQTCVGAVTQQTAQQYPSTASWWNPLSRDTNAGPRAEATMRNLKDVCGPPPRN